MTAVVAFLCTDGIVVAADSMLTPSIGGVNVGHHKGLKVEILSGQQVFAFAGDQGQGARFRILADGNSSLAASQNHPIDYALALTQALVTQFNATGIGGAIGVNTVLGYIHNNMHYCSVFEGLIQPRLLDNNHYYVALGSGKFSADPFLRFLVDTFCTSGQPNVREAIFLATWVIQHCIDTASGGISDPIKVGILEKDITGNYVGRHLRDDEVENHLQAVESAREALREWRDKLQSGAAAAGVPAPPSMSP